MSEIALGITIDRIDKWEITQTGKEEYLTVTYKEINETATMFYFKTSFMYKTANLFTDISQVPVEKLSRDTLFAVSKNILDLNNDDILLVEYSKEEFEKGISLKVGWESVTIDSSASAIATLYPISKSICITPNGKQNIAYVGSDSDLYYANSSDGITFTTLELLDGVTIQQAGIVCYSNNDLTVYFVNGASNPDLDAINYSSATNTWSLVYTIEDNIEATNSNPSCDVDSKDNMHCVFGDGNGAYYINSTILNSPVFIDDTSDYNIYSCSLKVADNDCVYSACIDNANELFFVGNCLGGWGVGNMTLFRTTIGSISDLANGFDIQYSLVGNNIYLVENEGDDLYFCNTTLDALSSPSCKIIDADGSNHPDIAVNENSIIEIIYANSASGTNDLYRANSSDGGITFTNRTILQGGTNLGFPSIADSVYPTSNKLTDRVYYVSTFVGASDLIYENYSIYYTGDIPLTSFTITLPSGQLNPIFNASLLSNNATNVTPTGQSNIPFFNVSNTGNTYLNFTFSAGLMPEGIELRIDTDNTSEGSYLINNSFVRFDEVSFGQSFGIWMWANFNNVQLALNEKNMTIASVQS